MTSDSVDTSLDSLYARQFPTLVALGPEDYFVDHGALDSFDFIRLMSELESTFAIKIADDDVTEANFGSKAGIRRYVLGRLQPA